MQVQLQCIGNCSETSASADGDRSVTGQATSQHKSRQEGAGQIGPVSVGVVIITACGWFDEFVEPR